MRTPPRIATRLIEVTSHPSPRPIIVAVPAAESNADARAASRAGALVLISCAAGPTYCMPYVFDLDTLAQRARDLAPSFRDAAPYPHIVIDDFLLGTA